MTTYGIRIDNRFISVAIKNKNGYTILNPLISLVPNNMQLENDNISTDIKCIGDLNIALSKQQSSKPTSILREDVLTNEME